MKLKIELVPESQFGANLRDTLTALQWDKCKSFVARRSGSKCEICGGVGPEHPIECHEQWEYNLRTTNLNKFCKSCKTDNDYIRKLGDDYDLKGTQLLVGLIALCPSCHLSKHYGYATVSGQEQVARDQLKFVNMLTEVQLDKYLKEEFEQWELRNKVHWSLNIEWLNENIDFTPRRRL